MFSPQIALVLGLRTEVGTHEEPQHPLSAFPAECPHPEAQGLFLTALLILRIWGKSTEIEMELFDAKRGRKGKTTEMEVELLRGVKRRGVEAVGRVCSPPGCSLRRTFKKKHKNQPVSKCSASYPNRHVPPQVLEERRTQQRGPARRGLCHRLLQGPLERRHLQQCRGLDLRARLLGGLKTGENQQKDGKSKCGMKTRRCGAKDDLLLRNYWPRRKCDSRQWKKCLKDEKKNQQNQGVVGSGGITARRG